MVDPLQIVDATNRALRHLEAPVWPFPSADAQAADVLKPTPGQNVGSQSAQVYRYRWDGHGRKGQRCWVFARGTMNSVDLEFEAGFRMVSSGNALRRA